MNGLNEYLQNLKKDLGFGVSELEEKMLLDFVEDGFSFYNSFDEACEEYASQIGDYHKEYVLKWLEQHYYSLAKWSQKAINEGYINPDNFDIEYLFLACQTIAAEELFYSNKSGIIECVAVQYLVDNDLDELDDELFETYLYEVDERWLDWAGLEEALERARDCVEEDDEDEE